MNTDSYNDIRAYIDKNPIATLGTVNQDGSPAGAVVYVCASQTYPIVYFLTKQETNKLQNLRNYPQASLTIVNPSENSTLQANGSASEVEDGITIDMVMDKISREHDYAKDWLPPIAKLRAGAYIIVQIKLSRARLAYFKGMTIGDERIFTELKG